MGKSDGIYPISHRVSPKRRNYGLVKCITKTTTNTSLLKKVPFHTSNTSCKREIVSFPRAMLSKNSKVKVRKGCIQACDDLSDSIANKVFITMAFRVYIYVGILGISKRITLGKVKLTCVKAIL